MKIELVELNILQIFGNFNKINCCFLQFTHIRLNTNYLLVKQDLILNYLCTFNKIRNFTGRGLRTLLGASAPIAPNGCYGPIETGSS